MDFETAHAWIIAELYRRRPLGESMRELVDRCASYRSHQDWESLRTLDYDDLSQLRHWIESPFRQEPISERIRGLWFGMFNPCDEAGFPTADIYVCGSERFDPDPDDMEWAVGPEWWPEQRYAHSSIMTEIYRIAYGSNPLGETTEELLGNDAEYPLCLGYGSLAVRSLMNTLDPKVILGPVKSLGVAVGFDSGDIILLGELTASGLAPIDLNAPLPPPQTDRILEALRSTDVRKVVANLFSLKKHGPRAQFALSDLLNIASSARNSFCRQAAIEALACIAPTDDASKTVIFAAFGDPNANVRTAALNAVLSFPTLAPSEIARIEELRKDRDKGVANRSTEVVQRFRERASNDTHSHRTSP